MRAFSSLYPPKYFIDFWLQLFILFNTTPDINFPPRVLSKIQNWPAGTRPDQSLCKLKDVKYSKSIVEDREFEQTRKALDARCKLLKKEGRGNRPFAAEAIGDDEVSVLYEINILGISSAEALINTVWLMNSIHFGLRGCDEHRQMCWSDVKLLRDADGTEYLEYCERQTKTRSGEEPRNIRPVKPKAFARPDGPPEKDPVFVYKFYSEKRPSSMQTVEAPYYLGINHSKDSSERWFKVSPM